MLYPRDPSLVWKGKDEQDQEAKPATARTLWVPAVNNRGGFGRWAFLEITDPYEDVVEWIRSISNQGRLSDQLTCDHGREVESCRRR